MALTEDKLIERIRRRIPSSADAVLRLGIGDDAAVLRPVRGTEWALSCDQFIEGVHFLVEAHPPEVVGYKALARATSDLAAMGARPRFFLLSLMLPASRTGRWLDRMLTGMSRAARRFGLTLAGGDTAASIGRSAGRSGRKAAGGVALNLTVMGELEAGCGVSRSGARAGDAIFVAGELGAAQLGLEIILRGMHRQRRWRHLLTPHYYPKLGIEIGRWLVRHQMASAMMDLSDGLSTDLTRLCRASRVGARIAEQSLPAVSVPEALCAKGIDARALALHGGEDYGLLFTVPKRWASRLPRLLYGTRITRIGEIVRGRGVNNGVELIAANGRSTPLEPKGWDHFRIVK